MTAPEARITRADLDAKLRQLKHDAEGATESARSAAGVVAPVAVAILLGVAYLLGRKRGKRKSTVVEIRRL